jgi:hypothetical protein
MWLVNTGIFRHATRDEGCELLSKTKIDLLFCKAISANEIPAKPFPTIIKSIMV